MDILNYKDIDDVIISSDLSTSDNIMTTTISVVKKDGSMMVVYQEKNNIKYDIPPISIKNANLRLSKSLLSQKYTHDYKGDSLINMGFTVTVNEFNSQIYYVGKYRGERCVILFYPLAKTYRVDTDYVIDEELDNAINIQKNKIFRGSI